jgi:hypothetical protein
MTAARRPRRSSKKLAPPVRKPAKSSKNRPRKTASGASATAPAPASARRPRIGYSSGSQLPRGAIRHPPGDQSVRRRLARSSGTQSVAFEKGSAQ